MEASGVHCGCLALADVNPCAPRTSVVGGHLTLHLHLDLLCKTHRREALRFAKKMRKIYRGLSGLGVSLTIVE